MGGSGGGGSRSFGRPSGPTPPPPGGAGGGGGGGGGGGRPDPCESIDENVILQSPKPTAVAVLRNGDELALQLTGGGAPVVAVNRAGQPVGSVVVRDLATLVQCLNGGRRFVADVLRVTGGAVTVRVHPEGA